MRITHKKTIIASIILIVLVVGGATYAYFAGYFSSTKEDQGTTNIEKSGTAYRDTFNKTQDQVAKLLSADDTQSTQQAIKIIDSQITEADKSGNESYSVDARLAKAILLINTDKPQEAIDTILIPLEAKYGDSDAYKYKIDTHFARAYDVIGDTIKADEYYKKVPIKVFE
ncbi:MAG: hypothetical protein ABIP50_00300 [Candidatus Saccharimonadales bacterium]